MEVSGISFTVITIRIERKFPHYLSLLGGETSNNNKN